MLPPQRFLPPTLVVVFSLLPPVIGGIVVKVVVDVLARDVDKLARRLVAQRKFDGPALFLPTVAEVVAVVESVAVEIAIIGLVIDALHHTKRVRSYNMRLERGGRGSESCDLHWSHTPNFRRHGSARVSEVSSKQSSK